MSAVAGVFTAFTTVNSRSVARIVIEVPIEQADAALAALGGFPKPAESRWVGIAPLVSEPAAAPPEPVTQQPAAEKVTRIDGRRVGPWKTLSRAQQAGLLCNDAEFQRYLEVSDAAGAAAKVRQWLGVKSRTEIDEKAANGWDMAVAEFRDWQRQQQAEARYGSQRR